MSTFDPPPSTVTLIPDACAIRRASDISSALMVSRNHSAGPPTLNVVNGASGTDAWTRSPPKRLRISSANGVSGCGKDGLSFAKRSIGFFQGARLELDPVARCELAGNWEVCCDDSPRHGISAGGGMV